MVITDQLPRFSDTIRAFGSITRPVSHYDEVDDEMYLRLQRERVMQMTQRDSLPIWGDIRDALKKLHHKITERELNEKIRQLLNIARDLTGFEWSMEMVESCAAFVLQMFYDSYYLNQCPGITNDHKSKLIEMFGSACVTNALVITAYEYAKSILMLFDDDERERLFNKTDTYSIPMKADAKNGLLDDYWGNDLHVLNVDISNNSGDNELITVEWNSIIDDIESAENSRANCISFEYGGHTVSKTNTVRVNDKSDNFNIDWINIQLTKFIEKFLKDHNEPFYMTIDDLMQLIITWLQEKSDDELASDLNNLLGDSCIELIRDLLKYRKSIIDSYNKIFHHETLKETVKAQSNVWDKKPVFAQQVVVHTVEEKNLKKQLRKCEKKLIKELNKDTECQSNNVNHFDIEKMKEEREKLLLRAMYAPLFKESGPTLDPNEFPYVFDSYALTKSTSAFISGTKMALPNGFIRNDYRRWEEVTIPAPPPATEITQNYALINIDTLDEFARIGFIGYKTLNQIQSIVFKTAYHTNENMLICAPTGAGKTNIAMLAILHEIKLHSQGIDSIQKDQFKIVYIAPMKALASEMTDNFSKKLNPMGINVRELTGDMQLTKSEIMNTQIIITTPEKWDVVTRKAKGDVQLLQLVRVLIIDEVHLLQSDRGPVLEALVARTIRFVESSQMMIRIIGLSATLPNYVDVAQFIHVNPREGLFVFDNRFRPVPLTQTFIGCKATQAMQQMHDMDEVTYEKVHEMILKGHQVMVFVHARNATYRTAIILRDKAQKNGHITIFKCDSHKLENSELMMRRARNKQLLDLFERGFAIHHAGMLRQDRNLVEKLFKSGVIKVLVCTSTLAWGVNLPAHAVIIRGTEMYDSSHGAFVDISMLDVMQIFGRAGRPQYDTEGCGIIITAHDKLRYYLSLLTSQYPIESQFRKFITDNMNAEIVSGTISTIDEAIEWLGYTYMYIRMRKNPLVYGIEWENVKRDYDLIEFRDKLARASAELLDKAKMIRYNPQIGTLDPTDLGRTASHYYIKYDTIEMFNELLKEIMDEAQILGMISQAQEFDQLKSRDDETQELDELLSSSCRLKVFGSVDDRHGKVNVLLQSFLSRTRIESFSLVSDSMFIMQNVTRITRGLFEYLLKRGNAFMANNVLRLSLMFEKQMWSFESPLRQFERDIPFEVMEKLERAKLDVSKILSGELTADEIGRIVRHQKYGSIIQRFARMLPNIEIEPSLKPITRTVLMVTLDITPNFLWNEKYHGKVCESFWIWIEDTESNHIYHSEYFKVTRKQVMGREMQNLIFNIPLIDADRIPSQYIIHAVSDRWIGCNYQIPVSCRDLILPEKYIPFTKLLDLDPLPVSALNNNLFQSLYKFPYFNPIQTQIFHTLYHTDSNVLLGAPTGSGKTIAAEIAMMRMFSVYPNDKIVYIAPMKALVRERVDDWKLKIEKNIGKRIVELTGDVMPDKRAIMDADVIVTTPEKWDGVSRSWQTRRYVQDIGLVIIDEIHLLGEDRGPVLEVIVSRTNFISSTTGHNLRIIGLSTAIANAQDLANWLNIKRVGLYNFKPSVRPVPIDVYVHGFPGKNYCPRMALMNKPTFRAILQHSPDKPTLVFVSSRRQTRLTALELTAFLCGTNRHNQWLHMDENEMEALIERVRDTNLRLTLAFGIGLHHAGLHEKDRSLVEELFTNMKIQVLITTATLAWGVNLPAHAVIIKGTEYYDGKLHRYVDFPITDVLQMMGRAGRPQYDTSGVAVILVHDIKKEYYKKFLYEPFPVESSLLKVLPEHLNAEIVAGTLNTKQDCIQYLSWTYLFRRITKNPTYYGLKSSEDSTVNQFLSIVIDNALQELINNYCIIIEDDDRTICSTILGRISSYYYLHHSTIKMFKDKLIDANDYGSLLQILTDAHEYAELPVRHNEDLLNAELSKSCPIKLNRSTFESSHTKANLLLQAHFSRLSLPCADYYTDLKTVLDQAIRIIQAMIDVAANDGFLPTALRIIMLQQMIVQSRWHYMSSLLILPHIEQVDLHLFPPEISSLPSLINYVKTTKFQAFENLLQNDFDHSIIENIYATILRLPFVDVTLSLSKSNENDDVKNIPVPLSSLQTPVHKRQWIPVDADTEYSLTCVFKRIVQNRNVSESTKAYAPKFPKHKDEGWIIVLGEVEKCELLALRRIGFIKYQKYAVNHKLAFTTPSTAGRVIYTFYLMSDSYLGLDQQYEMFIDVKK